MSGSLLALELRGFGETGQRWLAQLKPDPLYGIGLNVTIVRFYYSIGSRYSYLASSQIQDLERATGCEVEWLPLNSVALIARYGRSPFQGEPVSGQYDWAYRSLDATRWARLYGIPFLEPRGRVEFDPQVIAVAAVAANRVGQGEIFSRRIFSAIFAEPAITRVDRAECIRRAEACSISGSSFAAALDDAATARELSDTVDAAFRLGIFGVPTFSVGDQLFWGNDRLVLLREHLARMNAG